MPNFYMTKDGRRDIGKHGDQVRDVAFELWWLECSRDVMQVTKKLAEDPIWREQAGLAEGDKGPSDDSIRRWVKDEGWADEAHRRMRKLAPNMLERGAVALVYAFPSAVNTLTRVAEGKGSGDEGKVNTSDRIAADNAFRVVQLIAGDQLSALAKPVVDAAVDMSRLNEMSIDEMNEIERGMLSSG